MEKHTPTPWRYRKEDWHGGYVISVPKNQSDIYKSYGWDYDDGGGSGIAICEVPEGCAGEGCIAEANAAFIVRAVNAHEELLALVKDLAKFAPYALEQCARKAIATAEGRP